MDSKWRRRELQFLVMYAIFFYAFVIRRSLQLSRDYQSQLYGLRPGWIANRFNDVSDAQWRNFRGNLGILSVVFGLFTLVANMFRSYCGLKAKGMAIVWLIISLIYLFYLHGACVVFILAIASANFLLVKIFGRTKYFSYMLWVFNLSFLFSNRVYEGYKFSNFGMPFAFLDGFRGTFRWHICFNFGICIGCWASITKHMLFSRAVFLVSRSIEMRNAAVVLRMISYGYDYHWAERHNRFDQKKHIERCSTCSCGKTCYYSLQERSVQSDKFSFAIYLCYLVYAPLYIAGPIISFNAFTSQLDKTQNNYSSREIAWYGLRWATSLFLMELMTHFLCYNAFAVSGIWKQLSPSDNFIIGYGVLNFMWLKFFLLWRYFRFWSLINGIEAPENMPKCLNNCHNLETFWKNWHASFNKWLVRYMYIPLGGNKRKLLNVWVVFTFVAIWHDLEWKLLSWAWLTCAFFLPEILVKYAANTFQVQGSLGEFVFRELNAIAGAVTITFLMVANLVGFVIGPSGINLFISGFFQKQGLPTLGGMFVTFYVGTKLMFHISDAQQQRLLKK